MFKGFCTSCPHQDYCWGKGICQQSRVRKILGIVENLELSETAEVSQLDPEGDSPIIIINRSPDEEDITETDWV